MSTITPKILADIRPEINKSLEEVAKKYGFTIRTGNASYTAMNATFKLELAVIVDGVVKTKEANSFERNASLYGLKPEDLGRKFKIAGEEYELVGDKPRSTKYPLLGKRLSDSKVFKFPALRVEMAFNKTSSS